MKTLTYIERSKEYIALGLFNISAIKFGEFRLKDKSISPIYFDLRLLVSKPLLLRIVAHSLANIIFNLDSTV